MEDKLKIPKLSKNYSQDSKQEIKKQNDENKFLPNLGGWKKKKTEIEEIPLEVFQEKIPLVEDEELVTNFRLELSGLNDGLDSAGNILPSRKKISRIFFAFCIILLILNIVGKKNKKENPKN